MSVVDTEATKAVVPSYTRLSRLDRLRASGKVDDSEIQADDAETGDDEAEDKQPGIKSKKEKMKQRGKGKSLKRCVQILVGVTRAEGSVQIPEEKEEECDRPEHGKSYSRADTARSHWS